MGTLLELGHVDLVVQMAHERGDWFCAQTAVRALCEAGEFDWAWTALAPFVEAGPPAALREATEVLLRWRRTEEALALIRPNESDETMRELGRICRDFAQRLVRTGRAEEVAEWLESSGEKSALPPSQATPIEGQSDIERILKLLVPPGAAAEQGINRSSGSWRGGGGVPHVLDEGGAEFHAGTNQDVRTIMASLPAAAKDGFRYDAVPFDLFDHNCGSGSEVPGLLEELRTGDVQTANRALKALWGSVWHQGTSSAAGTLAVPFLIRIATTHPHHRADVLLLIAAVARRQHFGDGTRTGLLRAAHPTETMHIEPSGYLANWSVQAAREAVAADTHLLLPLLDDPEPVVRSNTAYALAAAPAAPSAVPDALTLRLAVEDNPVVRACLVLAAGQLAFENRDPATTELMHARWQDTDRPLDVRVSAALAWLCLTTGPIPADLDAFLDEAVTDDLNTLLAPVPWLRDVDDDAGLHLCLKQMCNPADYPWLTEFRE
ncbi:hypothetical protein [Kitasatospora sp. NPDC051914]|uniref:hypothetical protein n=1 Tax=Kitasatospora sp. NPDC051914 TaxID=3154945 RepID=UPI00341CB25E